MGFLGGDGGVQNIVMIKLTGPRYLMHCRCRSFLGHFSRFSSLPSPISSLQFRREFKVQRIGKRWAIFSLCKEGDSMSISIFTSKRKVGYSCYQTRHRSRNVNCAHNDGEDQSAKQKVTIKRHEFIDDDPQA